MGAEPYEYTVPYEDDIQAALEKLRNRVFASGEFFGAEQNPATPEQALEFAEESGTASILDISTVSTQPEFFCAAPFETDELLEYFGTDKPTRNELNDMFWDDLERGQARYVVLYENEQPSEIYFAGYSFD